MDSNKIKNLAQGARAQLMAQTEMNLERVLAEESDESIADPRAVESLRSAVGNLGKDALVEQVSYTWFNRLAALRFMDVRGYTPVPIVSPRGETTMPAILADARQGVFNPAIPLSARDREVVEGLLSGERGSRNPLGEAYVILLLAACDSYKESMGYLFGSPLSTRSALRLLAPTDLLSEGSVMSRIVTGMDEDTCADVEVLGWLYQFYIAERKDEVFSLPSSKKLTGKEIAPRTQLFTPHWIVRYLVENTLGRLWMLNFPDSSLKDKMDYYVEPEEPEQDFIKIYGPEDITFIDAACGSGHILVYAFELLYQMYLEEGYASEDIPEQILGNNLQGVEIDDRAAEIASFALEMKALEKDPDFLSKDVDARIAVCHKCDLSPEELVCVPVLAKETELLGVMSHFDEIGSLYKPSESDIAVVNSSLEQAADSGNPFAQLAHEKLADFSRTCKALKARYSCVAMNPPYLPVSTLGAWSKGWVFENFPDEKNDFCTCFIERGFTLSQDDGYPALITMQAWMFLGSYSKMRSKLLRNHSILNMAHLGTRAFDAIGGEVVSTTAVVFSVKKKCIPGTYIRLVDFIGEHEKSNHFIKALTGASDENHFVSGADSFSNIPGSPIAYWLPEKEIEIFGRSKKIRSYADAKCGMGTSNNALFLRCWYEVDFSNIGFQYKTLDETTLCRHRWFPYNKAGEYRKWYGDRAYVVNFYNNGEDIRYATRNASGGRVVGTEYYFRPQISWSDIATNDLSFRYYEGGFIFDASANAAFSEGPDFRILLAYFNSSLVQHWSKLLNPTIHFKASNLLSLPYAETNDPAVLSLVDECLSICRADYDSAETSWDFKRHPLVPLSYEKREQEESQSAAIRMEKFSRISWHFDRWKNECQKRFDQLKSNEEELNRIFASIYHMEGEVPIEVPDDKVSVRLADKKRDIKSLVSYAVGCMFGRYSLDKPGLILADAGSTIDDYHAQVPNPTFEPDEDGILPVLEEPWLKDDIVKRFRDWLKAAFGEESFEENLRFIEDALGMDIRTYFIKDGAKGFYANHCKTYSVTGSGKRPIYWMFSSPKHSFNALVYMHRYDRDTVAKILTDYVRPFRSALEAQAKLLESSPSAAEQSRSMKYRAMVEELDGWEHDELFELARDHVEIDLDDGVKRNYAKFPVPGVLRKI